MEHFIVFCIFYSKADRISSQSNKKGSWIFKKALSPNVICSVVTFVMMLKFFFQFLIIVSHFN